MRYVKKKIPIEAFKLEPDAVIPGWFAQAVKDGIVILDGDTAFIRTLEGVMRADPGTWIIQGVNGELYPCQSQVFDKTYEPYAEC